MMNHTIRLLKNSDEPILWEMLYHAIHVPPGEEALARDIVNRPELSRYVKDWGCTGDFGFLAVGEKDKPFGSVWLRQFTEGNRGYGYVDSQTPELSIAVIPGYRGKGIGTALLNKIIESYHDSTKISLSVSKNNPARKLYEQFGFRLIDQNNDSITMVLELKAR